MTEPVTEDQRKAVALFLAMEMHIADCAKCRLNESKFQVAMIAHEAHPCGEVCNKHHEDLRQISHDFCAEMNALSERFAFATDAAFGGGRLFGGVAG